MKKAALAGGFYIGRRSVTWVRPWACSDLRRLQALRQRARQMYRERERERERALPGPRRPVLLEGAQGGSPQRVAA